MNYVEFIGGHHCFRGPLRSPARIHRSAGYRSYANVVRNLIVIRYLFTSNIWRLRAIIHQNKLCRLSYRSGLSVWWWCGVHLIIYYAITARIFLFCALFASPISLYIYLSLVSCPVIDFLLDLIK